MRSYRKHSCFSDYARIKRKATYAVEGAETTFDRVTQISQITQIFLIDSFYVPQISQIYTDF